MVTNPTTFVVQVKVHGRRWEAEPGVYSANGFGTTEDARRAAEADAKRLRDHGHTARVTTL